MDNYFQPLIEQMSQRSAEATLSILGITDPNLRHFLSERFNSPVGSDGSFLADPVFEAIFGWEQADVKMERLAGSLIERSLIEAMDNPPRQLAADYAFKKNWLPYQHQLRAWRELSKSDPNSIVITSGTGSGKTECFMVPVLNDLVRQHEEKKKALIGVQALFIYPLNALINSQRDRLRAWTHKFENNIRFCLYNGNTPDKVKAKIQSETPNEILSRSLLRSEPPPLLVTNAIMLEYMLVRQVDSPILEHSQGQLRWIILDEAHTYMGSQAAELSLLLRRVMHGFGVKAQDVRFVATSATIGNKNDESLKRYLADLAGISLEQIKIIGGRRIVPDLKTVKKNLGSRAEMEQIDPKSPISNKRFNALAGHPTSFELRHFLTADNSPKTLNQIAEKLFGHSGNQHTHHRETLAWLDLCSGTSIKNADNTEQPFLPLRGHLFHQVINGLWCCVSLECTEKADTELQQTWPFGTVYTQQKTRCRCGAPVYELVFCNECNAPHLQAFETRQGQLIQKPREVIDEFSLQMDAEDDEGEQDENNNPDETQNGVTILAPKSTVDETYPLTLSLKTQTLGETENAIEINLLNEPDRCSRCSFTKTRFVPAFRHSLLGTPFYVSNTVPTLLEFCQDDKNALERPGRGRRLITFTDSRQGTARIATKIQQDSERNRLRGLVYEIAAKQNLNESQGQVETLKNEAKTYREKAEKFKKLGMDEAQDFLKFAKLKEAEIQELSSNNSISWQELVNELKNSQDVSRWMLHYYRQLNPILFSEESGRQALTQILLLREYNQRPRRQNSTETLGLISVEYPALKKVIKIPKEWENAKLSLNDWLDFLKICLDYYVRPSKFISFPEEWINWIGVKLYPREVISPVSEESTGKSTSKWPQVRTSNNHRLIRLLAAAIKLDANKPRDQDCLNQIMRAAWSDLTVNTGILSQTPGSLSYQLKLEQLAFRCPNHVWICPVTHRLLDTTLTGITPYLPKNADSDRVGCEYTTLPVLQDKPPANSDFHRLTQIRQWCTEQDEIKKLRSENLWTDLSDRIVEGGMFFRTAEHSAQQPAARLQQFETLFKDAKLNVLSCSTTMEMGVDIGGISMVAMNNVPPHPANYLQRSGRAGRRQETRAMAFTICKDNPHERSVFANSLWPFVTHIKSPNITLNSPRIIQRHVNSLVLSFFLKNVIAVQEKEVTKLDCGWFFCSDENIKSIADKLINWLNDCHENNALPKNLVQGLKLLIKNSILEGVKADRLLIETINSLQKIHGSWVHEYAGLLNEWNCLISSTDENNPYRKRIERDLQRLKGEYLLSELSARGFLPGYGFPTGIANFDPYSIHDFQSRRHKQQKHSHRDDNSNRLREKPGRDLSVAIREYAPGADIVLNGLVYKSAGITLNWHRLGSEFNETQKLEIEWRCHKCGAIDHAIGSNFDGHCHECGVPILTENKLEFIEPSGFAVDFYKSPTTDISVQHFVPVQEPWVATKQGVFTLPDPELGGFRASSDGHIFYHSSGEHGTGYAICMACGRAGSMSVENEYPDALRPGVRHTKLRGTHKDEPEAWCEGPDHEFAIKSRLHLGYVDRTDVCELYLKWPGNNTYLNHDENEHKKIAWTLAVVLRQALADILGVNSDELGFTVKPTSLMDCRYSVAAIALYDKNSGGAGFASSAPKYFTEIFQAARSYLNCPANCEDVCQNCLMGYDTRFHLDYLDRHIALSFLNNDFIRRISLPNELKILGNGSHYSPDTLFTQIRDAAHSGGYELKVFLHGDPDQWEIAETNLIENISQWKQLYSEITLFIYTKNVQQLPDSVKEDLWMLSRLGIKIGLVKSDKVNLNQQGHIIAQTSSNSCQITFAQTNLTVGIPSVNWLNTTNNVLIYSNEYPAIVIDSILEEGMLKPESGPGDIEIEILEQCNGHLNQFGNKFWQLVVSNHAALKKHIEQDDELNAVYYSDRFLYSPWTLILIGELIDGLRQIMNGAWNKPAIHIHTGMKRSEGFQREGLFADWLDNSDRISVIEKYFEFMDEQCFAKALEELPHGRLLKLVWSSGSTTIIRLDQGVGYWMCEKGVRFKNSGPSDEVASNLMKLVNSLKVKNQKVHPTQIFIKERKTLQ